MKVLKKDRSYNKAILSRPVAIVVFSQMKSIPTDFSIISCVCLRMLHGTLKNSKIVQITQQRQDGR